MGLKEKYTTAAKKFVQDHLQEDPAHLLFKYHQSVDFDLKFAVQQISARHKIVSKLPTWSADPEIIFPATISLEQSSSEATAKYKAGLMRGRSLVDLTGGQGIDTFFGSKNFDHAVYVERDVELCEIATHNFAHLSPGKFQVHQGDSLEFLAASAEKYDWIYIDPARRGDHNQKLYKLSDCEPDIVKHWSLLKEKGENILIKTSPILDIKAAMEELPDIQRVIVLAIKNEVKEILLISGNKTLVGPVTIDCVELTYPIGPFRFSYEEESILDLSVGLPKQFIIEPHATILKAGGFKSFSNVYNLPKLHVNSHLYTADSWPEQVMGRVYEIISEVKSDKKVIKKHFPSGKVNVVVRNYPLKAEDFKNKFRLKDGGEDFLIATTTFDGSHRLFHCRKVI